jgi:uncharacterized membrane protein YkvA (DUF1232 family)
VMLKQLRYRAKKLKGEILTIYYAYQHPRIPLAPKLVIIFTLGYALSPIDLIPDFIPVIGYLDDLIIIPALISLAIKLIPDEIMIESRARAEHEPLELKKNRVFAGIFIAIWSIILGVILLSIINIAAKCFR